MDFPGEEIWKPEGAGAMKSTGIIRKVDDLGRIVIPKEIRRTLRIREGDPLHTTLTSFDLFLRGIMNFGQRIIGKKRYMEQDSMEAIDFSG